MRRKSLDRLKTCRQRWSIFAGAFLKRSSPSPIHAIRPAAFSVHGLGVQFGYGEVAEDGSLPDSQLLEERATVDKHEQNYRLRIFDDQGQPIYHEGMPE